MGASTGGNQPSAYRRPEDEFSLNFTTPAERTQPAS